MNTDNEGKAAPQRPPKEYEMPETVSRGTDSRTRVEPIFDASGALRRHVLHKKDAVGPEQSGDTAPKKE